MEETSGRDQWKRPVEETSRAGVAVSVTAAGSARVKLARTSPMESRQAGPGAAGPTRRLGGRPLGLFHSQQSLNFSGVFVTAAGEAHEDDFIRSALAGLLHGFMHSVGTFQGAENALAAGQVQH